MNAIMGFSQLLMDDKTLTGKQRENLEIITSSSQHLLALIEDVLNLSRIESGHLNIQPIGVDPKAFFQELSNFFQKRPLKPGVAFNTVIASEWPPALNFDPKCVRQVCFNLLSNAFKFTSSGTVTLNVALASPDNQTRTLKIQVTDTGMGISEDEQKTIFDAFVQSSQGTNFDGYGLGLSICKGLVTQMGGTIKLESRLSEGSCFTVSLPVTLAELITPANDPHVELPAHSSIAKLFKLLIVDDIESNRKLLIRLLENSGYSILEAANAKAALEIVENQQPDLVMMDIRMPVMNGDEALKKMRKNPSLAKIPVIAITANAVEGERERLLEMGAAAFISKPFSRTEVFQTITRVLHAASKTQIVSLPESPPQQPTTVATTSKNVVSKNTISTIKSPSILVVDDNKANLQLLTSQLAHLGLSADVAHDGEEGYQLFTQKKYDLIFSDCHMPVLDGFELASRIRHFEMENDKNSHAVIIAITGSPEEFRTKCFQCGMDDVIGKPLLLNTLKRNLEKFNLL
jgi:CheY-like chemotaxis protein